MEEMALPALLQPEGEEDGDGHHDPVEQQPQGERPILGEFVDGGRDYDSREDVDAADGRVRGCEFAKGKSVHGGGMHVAVIQ